MKTIYADYQATTPVDPRVFDKMAPYWQSAFGNPHSSEHVVGWRAAEAVDNSAASVANLIGADPDEVVFTSGATEANNMALFGLAHRAPPKRNRILVSAVEHKCVLAAAHALSEREGFIVETIPVDGEGFVDLDFLESRLDESVLVVSVMAVNNEIGTIQDIPSITTLTKKYGVPFHCDAAQAPCAMDVSYLAEHADLISLSGHKIYGPQGIGALYIRRDFQSQIEPLIYGGGQQSGLRSGTVPLPLCVGLGAASEIILSSEQKSERRRVAEHRDRFVNLVESGPFRVAVNGPLGDRRHPGNANLRFDGLSAQDILGSLQPRLAASTGAACTTGIPEPSHVLRAIGLSPEQADSSIRFSFGRFTTEEQGTEAADCLKEVLLKVSDFQ
ncbi:MAG: cysteine desulfurase family protein [Dehalococcoidia bacterium]|nr:cysteine desulfurase family protein [Dehalococcoidia bacterium]